MEVGPFAQTAKDASHSKSQNPGAPEWLSGLSICL